MVADSQSRLQLLLFSVHSPKEQEYLQEPLASLTQEPASEPWSVAGR